MVAYWSSDWVKGNAAAATNAPIIVTLRCLPVSAEIRPTSPALACCGEAEAGGDEEADEEFVVFGADAVGEDDQAEGECRDDDQDLGVRGELAGRGGGAGGEGRLDDGAVVPCLVAELLPGGVFGVEGVGRWSLVGQGECAEQCGEGGDGRDPAAGFEVGEAAELGADRDDRVPGGGERGECGEFDGAVGACRCQPAQALDAVGGEAEQCGEGAADEDEDLQAARVAVDGEVTGEG